MSLKMKLVSMVSAFVLVIGMLLIGVFAVERVQVDMGGSITFNADDVYARVTGSVANAQVAPTGLDVTYSAYETEGNPTAWKSLDLEFDSYATPIVISIKVENLSTERSLTVNLTDALTSSVPNLGKALQRDNSAYTSGTNIPLDPKGNGTSTTTFTITLSVTDKNQSLNNAQFDYDLNLYDESAVPEPPEVYSGFEFNILDENTAEITGYTGTDTEVIIPSTFSIGTTLITSFTMNEDYSSDIPGDSRGGLAMMALYLGGFYYTPQGGERTYCANFIEFQNIMASLTFPVYFEPQYKLSLGNYSEENLQMFQMYIMGLMDLQRLGYNDGNFYFTTADGQYNNTLVNAVDIYNSLSSVQDPTELQSMFPMQLNLASTFGVPVYVEGDDYVVKSIGDRAFSDCSGLTSVDLSNCTSLTSIGDYAFQNCRGLTSISLPSSLTSIGYSAFDGCSGLKGELNLGGCTSLTSIGGNAFRDCSGLTGELDLSNCTSLTSIGSSAFDGCSGLTGELDLSNCTSLTSIGSSAFDGCSGLTGELNLGGCTSLTSIGYSAFNGCSGLKGELNLGGCTSLTSIGSNAFYGCSGLTIVDLSGCTSLTSIGNAAFSGCSGLTSVDLSGCTSLTSIRNAAFNGCRGLTSISLPSSLTSIGYGAFSGCSKLQPSATDQGVKYLGSEQNPYLVLWDGKDITSSSYIVNSNCKVICSDAFRDCSGLTSITLPSSLTSIGSSAFYRCSGLTSIDLGNCTNLTSIEDSSFFWCERLERLILPASITSISGDPFYGCSEIEIVEFKGTLLEWLSVSIEYGGNTWITSSYKFIINGEEVTNLVIPEGIEVIGDQLFTGCSGLTSISLPSSLTSIGYSSFSGCTGLKSIDLSGCTNLTSIRDRAFTGCRNLTSITLPSSLTSIGRFAFSGCRNLTSIIVEEGNTVYHSEGNCLIETESNTLVLGCKNSIIPSYITSIGDSAFSNCSELTSIDLSNCTNLTSIGDSAFGDCAGLTSITLPASLTSIGSRAFYPCDNLTEVIIDSEYVYTNATSMMACGHLLFNATTVKVLTSLVQENHAYINSANFTNVTTEGDYTVYKK